MKIELLLHWAKMLEGGIEFEELHTEDKFIIGPNKLLRPISDIVQADEDVDYDRKFKLTLEVL
jgi:hypothetical protein